MTGFGSARAKAGDVELEITIRSINSRYLDQRLHLPKEHLPFEKDIKDALTEFFARGCVDVTISRRPSSGHKKLRVQVQEDALKQWTQALQKISKQTGAKLNLEAQTLATLSEVIQLDHAMDFAAPEKAALLKVLKQAAKTCLEARIQEGKSLQKELLKLLKSLEDRLNEIESHSKSLQAGLQNRIEERVRRLSESHEVDSHRLAQEVVFYLDRSDIAEEITRLRTHIKNFLQLIKGQESQGKKMDFYTQELLREVNTIGSKSIQAELTAVVVDAKSLVEKIREQVQNIE